MRSPPKTTKVPNKIVAISKLSICSSLQLPSYFRFPFRMTTFVHADQHTQEGKSNQKGTHCFLQGREPYIPFDDVPKLKEGQLAIRGKVDGTHGIEKVDVQQDNQQRDDPLHYLLRRVCLRLDFRARRARVFPLPCKNFPTCPITSVGSSWRPCSIVVNCTFFIAD